MKKSSPIKITDQPCCKIGNRWRKIALGLFILLILILGWYFLSEINLPFADWLINLREEKTTGFILYFLITITAIIAAPLSTLPLTPLAANLWGWQSIFLISITAWQIGAIINFLLIKKYGQQILQKFTNPQKINQLISHFPQRHHFITIFLLRMTLPVDILSYALGLVKIKFSIYFWATLFGITPFAFVLSYGGQFLSSWQIVPIIIGSILILIIIKKLLSNYYK